jgi:hypothetical protein
MYSKKFNYIKAETEKAILAVDFQNKQEWLPKSVIHINNLSIKSIKITIPFYRKGWKKVDMYNVPKKIKPEKKDVIDELKF